MDMVNKPCYTRIKIYGKKESIEFESPCIRDGAMAALAKLTRLTAEFRGTGITLEFSTIPFDQEINPLEKYNKEVMAGLDMSLVRLYADMSPEEQAAHDLECETAFAVQKDALLVEYRSMTNKNNIARSTPERLAMLRKHVESTYAGTPHWNGVHLY
jgi:hypothetical protein